MEEITADPKGIEKLLEGLNVHKAPGPDGLDAIVLKELTSVVHIFHLSWHLFIFNESLAQGNVPDDWREANLSPVFKKRRKMRCCEL